jgi:hypothetical protein
MDLQGGRPLPVSFQEAGGDSRAHNLFFPRIWGYNVKNLNLNYIGLFLKG